jgi:Flp pilus assembly pilin Flp
VSKTIAVNSKSTLAGGQRSPRRVHSPHRRREVKGVLESYNRLVALRKREEGQTMAEYGVVLAVITIAVFGALTLLSGNITGALNRVAGFIGAA